MAVSTRGLLNDLRREQRYAVNIHGVAQFSDGSTSVKIVDLSFGGARISLPLPCSAYDIRNIRFLRIDQAVQMRVNWRWSRDKLCGLEFIAPQLGRTTIQELIETAPLVSPR